MQEEISPRTLLAKKSDIRRDKNNQKGILYKNLLLKCDIKYQVTKIFESNEGVFNKEINCLNV